MKMKLIFEGWRRFMNEGDVVPFRKPQKEDNITYIPLTRKQALELEKFVNEFGGSILSLLQPAQASEKETDQPQPAQASEKETDQPLGMVAEQEEQEGEAPAAPAQITPEKPSRLATRIPKGKPGSFGTLTTKEFEEGNYVLPIPKEAETYIIKIIKELRNVENAFESSKKWYFDVNKIVQDLVGDDQNKHVLFSSFLAAFSHNTMFYTNLIEAIFALKAYELDMEKDPACLQKYVSSLPGHKVGAKFGKLKLTNFALNILNPELAGIKDEEGNFVNWWNSTMDRWMFRAFYPEKTKDDWKTDPQLKGLSGRPAQYLYLNKYLVDKAEDIGLKGLSPLQMQAVIWVAIMNERTGRVDTLDKLMNEMEERFKAFMQEAPKPSTADKDLTEKEGEKVSEVRKLYNQLVDRKSLFRAIRSNAGEGSKSNKLQIFSAEEAERLDAIKATPGKCVDEALLFHNIMEGFVGMRTDKKKNIRNITLRAMGAVKDSEGNPQTWDIQSGTEYFTNLINLDATRATKIIP